MKRSETYSVGVDFARGENKPVIAIYRREVNGAQFLRTLEGAEAIEFYQKYFLNTGR